MAGCSQHMQLKEKKNGSQEAHLGGCRERKKTRQKEKEPMGKNSGEMTTKGTERIPSVYYLHGSP